MNDLHSLEMIIHTLERGSDSCHLPALLVLGRAAHDGWLKGLEAH